ncbi:hypothetical protein [Burkholderia plantarii]|uniref:Putative integrase family protein n=1 Tax=Burkholderia plantarii TaxID=41899 RepID=A0A0B6S1V4_BURPL|nr:hypothetical protein [Burkholderia plantarii]AJK46221.1 putative integrase family protein [Burkholderia plantarii]
MTPASPTGCPRALHASTSHCAFGGSGRAGAQQSARSSANCSPRNLRTPTRNGHTALQVEFASADLFDREIDDLVAALALMADRHECVSESEARAVVDGQPWRW